jgi:hypothetical protein
MILEIAYLEAFLEKCQRMMEAHPQEAKKLVDALYDLLYATFFAGYIRGKDPDFDYNDVLSDIFARFSTDEWKEFNGVVLYEDEDYFRRLGTTAFDIAERLYPIIERLKATEPIKGPIGRVVFEEKEEKEGKNEG